MLPLEDSWTLMLVNKRAELKMLEKREVKSAYVGANLQTSRTPSAIDHHCRSSYKSARRKLHSSRAKVRFYAAGENNHNAIYAVSPQRFASFDSLLGSLTKTPICSPDANRERYIFSLNGSHKITALDELHPGESYVCATYEVFQQLSEEKERPISSANRYQTLHNAALAAARLTHTSQSSRSQRSATQENQLPKEEHSEESQFIAELKPKLITVLRGGSKPRRSVRILLSKKNTRSFEQTIAGIGEILCAGEPIKRLFGTSGRLVMCLADFYLEDSVFFAYSHDKMNPEDLCLDETEVRFVGAYRFRKASAYGRVTLTSHQKGLDKERSIQASPSSDNNRLSNESRIGSRMKSRLSLTPSSPRRPPVEEEKHSQVGIGSTSRTASQSSIKTADSESKKSKESIHLTPSRSSNVKPAPTHSGSQSVVASLPPTPVHSPSRKRHSSINSQEQNTDNASGHVSRLSNRQTPDNSKSLKSQKSEEERGDSSPKPLLNHTLSAAELQEPKQTPSTTESRRASHTSQNAGKDLAVTEPAPPSTTTVDEQEAEPTKLTGTKKSGSHSSIQESLHSQRAEEPETERRQSYTSTKSTEKSEKLQTRESSARSRHESNTSKSSKTSVESKHSIYSSTSERQGESRKSPEAEKPGRNLETNNMPSSRKSSISSTGKSSHSPTPRSDGRKSENQSPRGKSISRTPSKQSMQSKMSSLSDTKSIKDEQASATENTNNEQEKDQTSRPASQTSQHSTASKSSIDSKKKTEETERTGGVPNGSVESVNKSSRSEESGVDEDQYSVDFENTVQDTDDNQEGADEKIPNNRNEEKDTNTP